jgi:hypothetical protein
MSRQWREIFSTIYWDWVHELLILTFGIVIGTYCGVWWFAAALVAQGVIK